MQKPVSKTLEQLIFGREVRMTGKGDQKYVPVTAEGEEFSTQLIVPDVYKRQPMDWSLGADGNKNQIFADGELMWEARYPNIQEGDTITNFTRATSKAVSGFKSGDKTQSLLVDPDLKTFATTEDFFYVATIWDVPGSAWTALTFKVTSYDPATGTLTYPSSARGMDRSSYAPKSGT